MTAQTMTGPLPLLTCRWDSERERLTYRVQPAGTSRFVLLSADELRLLRSQITRALEGTDAGTAS